MKSVLKFKLDRIPERIGLGFKAKMCARPTHDAREVIMESQELQGMNPSRLYFNFLVVLETLVKEAARTGGIIHVEDFFTIEPHVRGRFEGIDDTFDPSRGHSVALTLKAGDRLRPTTPQLMPENEVTPITAQISNVLSLGAPPARHNRLVFGRPLSVVGRNLDLLEGDAVRWRVQLPGPRGETLEGAFAVLENDADHLLLAWPDALPREAIGRMLDFTLESRGGNPQAVRRTVVRHWPIGQSM